MFKIEKNVKMDQWRERIRKYPFKEMDIGDSFLFPCSESEREKHTARYTIYAAIGYFKKKNSGYKFSVRSVDGGFRVWRVPHEEAPSNMMQAAE